MPTNNYKIFFTVSFVYQVDKKKKVSKSFKSDVDINADNVNIMHYEDGRGERNGE